MVLNYFIGITDTHVRQATDDERKQMTALGLKQMILVDLQKHIFSFNKKIYKQNSGGTKHDRGQAHRRPWCCAGSGSLQTPPYYPG